MNKEIYASKAFKIIRYVVTILIFYCSINFLLRTVDLYLWWNYFIESFGKIFIMIPLLYCFLISVKIISFFNFFDKKANPIIKTWLDIIICLMVITHVIYWIIVDFFMGNELRFYQLLIAIHVLYLLVIVFFIISKNRKGQNTFWFKCS